MYYSMVIIATLLLAFDFSLLKKYQALEGTSVIAGLRFNALNGLFTAVIFFGFSGFQLDFSWYSTLLAFIMSLFAMIYTIIGCRVLRDGNISIYSLFLMSGSMLLPYLFGIIFLDETITFFRIFGIFFILASAILSYDIKYKPKPSFLLLCIAVFILNGAVSIISKCHQINTTFQTVSSTIFIIYTGLAKVLIGCAVLPFCKERTRFLTFSSKKAVMLVICSALIGGISYMLQLTGAKELPASVLYPIVSGGSIIFSALWGRIFYKEKLSVNQLISIALCFIGTLLFL